MGWKLVNTKYACYLEKNAYLFILYIFKKKKRCVWVKLCTIQMSSCTKTSEQSAYVQ